MNSKFSRIKFSTLLVLFCSILFISISAKMNDKQYIAPHYDEERLNLFAPIVPTSSGMRTFFERTFNRPEYIDVLAQDFSHFCQCLNYAFKKYNTRTHAEHVCNLFHEKTKDCLYVNATAFSQMLDNVTPVLSNYLEDAEQKALTCWQTTIDKILSDAFLKQFALFKKQPLAFLHELSGSIADNLYDPEQALNDISIPEFRTAITTFFDICMSKLVWHPEDGLQTWKLVVTIADQLHQLHENSVISEKELHGLYNTLVIRYCFFLGLISEELPLAFFDSIKRELAAHNFDFIDCGELESCLESKRQRLARSLLQAEAKVRTATLPA